MTSNHELTTIIKGRTISGTSHQDDLMTINFGDGSKMTIKTAGSTNTGSTGGTIDKAQQEGCELGLIMTDGSTTKIPTAEEMSCVMIRDKDGVMEYAD